MLSRRGMTLLELLVALWVTVLLAGVLAALARGTLRGALRVRAAATVAEAVRSGAALARHEFEPLAAGGMLPAGDSAVRYGSVRGSGHACALAATALVAPLAALRLLRAPVPGRDTLLVFGEGDPARADDDAWLTFGLIASAADRCPDGRAALRLSFDRPRPATIGDGAPLLLLEPMELRRYASLGQAWLGARALATGEAIQPVLGPLAGSEGLSLSLRSADGAPIAPGEPAAVVRVALRAAAAGAQDSVVALVPLLGQP